MSAEISRCKCDYGSMIEWWQCSHTEFSSSQLQTQNCSFWSPRSLRNLACVERLSLGPSGPGVHMFQHFLVPFSNFAAVVALGCCYFITGDPLLLSFCRSRVSTPSLGSGLDHCCSLSRSFCFPWKWTFPGRPLVDSGANCGYIPRDGRGSHIQRQTLHLQRDPA